LAPISSGGDRSKSPIGDLLRDRAGNGAARGAAFGPPLPLSCSRHCTAKVARAFWLACLPALALSPFCSPRPHGRTLTILLASSNARRLTMRQRPLRARRGINPSGNRNTRPETASAAAATIIATGAIRGRNHAERRRHCPVWASDVGTGSRRRRHLSYNSSSGLGAFGACAPSSPFLVKRHPETVAKQTCVKALNISDCLVGHNGTCGLDHRFEHLLIRPADGVHLLAREKAPVGLGLLVFAKHPLSRDFRLPEPFRSQQPDEFAVFVVDRASLAGVESPS
jgi:hypothetical protein